MFDETRDTDKLLLFEHFWNTLRTYKMEGDKEDFESLLKQFNEDFKKEFTAWNLSDSQAEAEEQRNDVIKVETLWKAQQDRQLSGAHL